MLKLTVITNNPATTIIIGKKTSQSKPEIKSLNITFNISSKVS